MGNGRDFSWRRLILQVADRVVGRVEQVPPELDACEFDCRKSRCAGAAWADCPKRLRHERRLRALEAKTAI